ncbi:hypothetical protein Q7C36_015616 [Tachysurus vachellii]|uniref:Uncharacterized protein n=1 Tax=Tachysurus vachellii TaxID=175792 RepID=A0AA88M9K8_TACVA|nr:hypothetical protein Q7C36_015616 [Tachysurus vachellii]
MATGKRKQANTNRWRRKRSCVGKAGARKHVRRSPRRHTRRVPDPVCGHKLPAGAMAPTNTTQYLMELVYSELNITASPHAHTYSYTSAYTDQDTMDFQRRDFESVFFRNEV